MPSPICTVQDGAGSPQSTLDGVNVTSGDTITIALQSTAGVDVWSISCIYTDETNTAATITAALTINALAKTATFTAPAIGSALIFQSRVNNGKNSDFKDDPSLTTTFGIFVLTASGQRVVAANQIYEGDHLYGWIPFLNAALRAAPSGVGTASKVIASTSAAITAGQGVCMADDGVKVTLADATAVTAKGAIEGIALTSGTAGQTISIAVEDALPAAKSGLGAGAIGPVRYNTTTKACERVTSYSAGDIPVGEADALGNVTMVRGIIIGVAPTGSAGGALGGSYPNPTIALGSNSGITGVLDASKVGTGGALGGANMAASTIALGGNASLTGQLESKKVARGAVTKTTTYTVDAGGTDDIIFADTSGASWTLTLPPPTVREIVIIDVKGTFATNPLTLARNSTEKINLIVGNRTLSAALGIYRVFSNGTDWFF